MPAAGGGGLPCVDLDERCDCACTGSATGQRYRIGTGTHRFGYRLRPYRVGAEDPPRLAREDPWSGSLTRDGF